MPKLRTKFQPEKELDVTDVEAARLHSLGVVVETKATTPEGARRAAERTAQEG